MYASIALRTPLENYPAANDIFEYHSSRRVSSSSQVFVNINASLCTSSNHELHLRTSAPSPDPASNGTILIHEPNVPRPLCVPPDKLLIARRPLVFRITGQHALEAHTDRLHILDGRPALRAEQVETDDAVGVDVRVNGNGAKGLREGYECDFGCFFKSYED